ncbi:MAG: GPR endopeptidase [Eubacteriales bacterium]
MVSQTDLAREKYTGRELKRREKYEFEFVSEEIDVGREGKYITVLSPKLICDLSIKESLYLSRIISREILMLTAKVKSVAVIGLGNRNMTVDSFGVKTAELITPTKTPDSANGISLIIPGVESMTGISSFKTVSSLLGIISPDIVIAVDSLAARSPENLGRSVQISNIGICPGSGLGNRQHRLDSSTLAVPVVSVGIPTVISASKLYGNESGMYVALSQSDAVVDSASRITASAIESAFS